MATTSVGEFKPRAHALALSPDLLRWIVAIAGVLAMWAIWQATSRRVEVSVDGVTVTVNTHRRHVRELLTDLGVDLHANDRVSPALETALAQAQGVSVERARPVQIVVDGRTIQTASWGPTPRALLEDAGILVDAYDKVIVGDVPLGLDQMLPPREQVVTVSEFAPVRPWARTEAPALQVRVVRAVPVVVDDVGIPFVIRTTAPTVGEALRQAESVPVLDRIETWLDERAADVLPRNVFVQAIGYVRNQWEALRRYTEDGRLTIDNNQSERTLRLQAIGRKNWLFLGSERGGQTAAVLFSVLAYRSLGN